MRWFLSISTLLLVVLVAFGCSNERAVQPGPAGDNTPATAVDPELLAGAIVAKSGWSPDASALSPRVKDKGLDALDERITMFDRQTLVDDIVHYSCRVRIGPGQYDVIGLHRVVREARPYQPIRTKKSVFLQHGDAVGFVKFLFGVASPNKPDEQSAAVFWAANGVDVWGIDQDWILIPEAETNHSFMADWGLQHNVDNLRIGMSIARLTRLMTGNGFRKMHLLGYSSGVWTTFALMNEETQLPPGHRNASGFIPVDGYYKTDIEEIRLSNCADAAYFQDLLNGGIYADNGGVLFRTLGFLAQTDPDGPSPIIEGLTNLETALMFGAATFEFFLVTPWYHYVAGVFEDGFPVDLRYTTIDGWLDFIQLAASYEPNRFLYEYIAVTCDEENMPFDDYLSEISVPILYVGAAGGMGETGFYTVSLTGSTDITLLNIQLLPPEEITMDYGHIDLFSADNAEEEAWIPILDWINDHTPGNQGGGHDFADK